MRRPSSSHGKSGTVLSLLLLTCLTSLAGCASKPIEPDVNCPEPTQIPATLSEPSFPHAQAYSNEVQSFLQEVADWLKTLRQTKTPSSK